MCGGLFVNRVAALKFAMFKIDTTKVAVIDLPPLKWSSLMYVFDRGGYGDGKEEACG